MSESPPPGQNDERRLASIKERAVPEEPLIVVFSEDYFLIPRLTDASKQLGYQTLVVERPSVLDAEGPSPARDVPLTEPLEGADAHMLRNLRAMHPALLLMDLNAREIPVNRWIQVLKTSSATRRIPILAFGSHVDSETLESARLAGADAVVTRGQLQASLAELIQRWARIFDLEAIRAACTGELSEQARKGVELHNQGEYYEAHEALELAWMEEQGALRHLYRALLQVSVAYLHIERGNERGARKMLLRLRQWLDPLPETCCEVDVRRLKADVGALRTAIEGLDAGALKDLDRTHLRPFRLLT